MAWCLVLGLLLLLRGMPSPSLPHLRPAKTSGTEMGEGQFQPGQKYLFPYCIPLPPNPHFVFGGRTGRGLLLERLTQPFDTFGQGKHGPK